MKLEKALFSEYAITSAAVPGHNEDYYASGPDFALVLDGAPPDEPADSCPYDTSWFVQSLAGALVRTVRRSSTLTGCLAGAIDEVRELHARRCPDRHAVPASTVVLTRTSGAGLDYLVLGDSFLVAGPGQEEVLTDDRIRGEALATYAEVQAAPGGSPEHQEAVRRHRAALQARRNVPGGYWLAADRPEAAGQALTGTLDGPRSETVLLATDGLARLTFFTLASWSDIAAGLRRGVAAELVERLRQAEARDAAGLRWPRAKCHDDATGVLLRGQHPEPHSAANRARNSSM